MRAQGCTGLSRFRLGCWMAVATAAVLSACQIPSADPEARPDLEPVTATATPVQMRTGYPEQTVQTIPLAGPAAEPEAEISGLDWFGDVLVLLPQYPDQYDHNLFGLPRQALAAALSDPGKTPIEPFPIPLVNGSELRSLEGYEGLEAIVFTGSRFYLAVEGRSKGRMLGYLIPGKVLGNLDGLELDLANALLLPPQTSLMNKAYESLLMQDSQVVAIHELAGRETNPERQALLFSAELETVGTLDVPEVEFRITDATRLDPHDRFWAINFHWPGEKQLPAQTDAIRERWGEGASHKDVAIVERLLEMEIRDGRIALVDRPPIELVLLDEVVARNWEGIVRWADKGVLLVTDRFPTTILAFVPFPENE